MFYNTIVKYLKLPDNRIDWSILKKHQVFVREVNEKTVFDSEIEAVQKELNWQNRSEKRKGIKTDDSYNVELNKIKAALMDKTKG